MKRLVAAIFALLVVAGATVLPAHAQTTQTSQTTKKSQTAKKSHATKKSHPVVIVDLKPSNEKLAVSLAAQVTKAKAMGLKPFVEFSAGWCPPCRALKASLESHNALMMKAFAGTYIIRMDSDAWGSKLGGTGFSVNAIPVFYALDGKGKPTGRSIDGGAWGDNTPENMAPPLSAFFKH
jgi:thiol-disulfide isomerase/thioredoxin